MPRKAMLVLVHCATVATVAQCTSTNMAFRGIDFTPDTGTGSTAKP